MTIVEIPLRLERIQRVAESGLVVRAFPGAACQNAEVAPTQRSTAHDQSPYPS